MTVRKDSPDDVSKSAESPIIKNLKPLPIPGGLSTRMGSAKHLLLFPNGTPLYQRTLQHLHHVCPSAEALYVLLREKSQWES